MTRTYIVTGAAGYLGNVLCRQLVASGATVRAVVLPNTDTSCLADLPVTLVEGDVREAATLDAALTEVQPAECTVLHLASVVSIASRVSAHVRSVNVGGTAAVIEACRRHRVPRLVYVSSVHAIPDQGPGHVHTEVDHFDPRLVHGEYAKTKAEATELVLDANDAQLQTVVVHPSGICGPGDHAHGHITALVAAIVTGRMRVYVDGGYDFVDVRDVADGIIAAADHGVPGECYILSGGYLSMSETVQLIADRAGRPTLRRMPAWVARLTAPMAEAYFRVRRQSPEYTPYAVRVLESQGHFSSAKATATWGYAPHDPAAAFAATVDWLTGQQT